MRSCLYRCVAAMRIIAICATLIAIPLRGSTSVFGDEPSKIASLRSLAEGADVIFIGRLRALTVEDSSSLDPLYFRKATAKLDVICILKGEVEENVDLTHEIAVPRELWPDSATGVAVRRPMIGWGDERLQAVKLGHHDITRCMLYLVFGQRSGDELVPASGMTRGGNSVLALSSEENQNLCVILANLAEDER